MHAERVQRLLSFVAQHRVDFIASLKTRSVVRAYIVLYVNTTTFDGTTQYRVKKPVMIALNRQFTKGCTRKGHKITRTHTILYIHTSIHPLIYPYTHTSLIPRSGHESLPIPSTPTSMPAPTPGPPSSGAPIPNMLDKYNSQSCALYVPVLASSQKVHR